MKRAFIAVAVASLGITGCQEAYTDPSQTEQSETPASTGSEELINKGNQDDFNALDSHLAALATEVLLCKGSFTQKDFFIDDRRVLHRCTSNNPRDPNRRCNFECPLDKNAAENIDNLLGVQDYDLLPERKEGNAGAVPYFAGRWAKFVAQIKGLPCPNWKFMDRINFPDSPDVVRKNSQPGSPQKTNYRWAIDITPDCARRDNPIACSVNRAQVCASWAGLQFLDALDRVNGVIETDPKWWKDNTNYGDSTPGVDTPYDPSIGYEHEMAEWGLPPGDRWGAINRQEEHCHVWNTPMTVIDLGSLKPVDCGGWACMTTCVVCPGAVCTPALPL